MIDKPHVYYALSIEDQSSKIYDQGAWWVQATVGDLADTTNFGRG
ncbi:hypothetical protein [Effusibacillus pohliae]|nr:hypothetical protein [Effusibacillus pohliae]